MKKLFIVALAATLCIAFTVPAMAKVRLSGWIGADFVYKHDDSEFLAGGVLPGATNLADDLDTVHFSSPDILNRIGVRYNNDDGSVIGVIELRGGMMTGSTDNRLSWNYAYIMWRLNPIFRLQIGRQSQTFSIMNPSGTIDWENTKQTLAGYGNIVGTSSRQAIKALVKFTDQVRLEFQLLDPDNDGGDGGRIIIPRQGAPGGPGGNAPEENTIPRIDIALNIKVANFTIEPSFTWNRSEFDQVAAGNDDDVDAFGFSLGVKAGFGPISLKGEFSIGQNLGNGSYNLGGPPGDTLNGARTYVDANGFTRVEDTDSVGGWVEGAYNFGPATFGVTYGIWNIENDGNPALSRANDPIEFDLTRQMFAVWLRIKLAKGFSLTPVVNWLTRDDSAEWGPISTTQDVDFGTRTIVGATFLLRF